MSDTEKSYSLVILAKVNPERELPTDIYLKIDQKYIRFRGQGDVIGAEKFDDFMQKGLEGIYVLADEIMIFLDWITNIRDEEINETLKESSDDTREIVTSMYDVKEKVYETFLNSELNEEVVEELQEQVNDFVSKVKEQPFSKQTIAALITRNSTLADHSVNVANLSVYLAMVMGHGHQLVLENIYLGAILHYLGKAKAGLTEIGSGDGRFMSQAMQGHPELSVKVIRKSKGLPDAVYKIILQHHEQFNGFGYPAGLHGDDIYEMAQIVSIANVFDNILYENRQLPRKQAWELAIKKIELGKERYWHSKFFPRVVDALKLAKQI